MVALALVLGALLSAVAVWFVARPFLRAPAVDLGGRPDEPDRRRLGLEEERDRALAALKELEFDHRTGKISDDDYRQLVGELRRAAADALRALDPGISRAMANPHRGGRGEVETPVVPEPTPVPHEPPGPVIVPEPDPVPHEPPGPVIVPEPDPVPHEPPGT